MRPRFAAPLLLAVAIKASFAQLPDDLKRQFDEAEQRIVRLPPAAFSFEGSQLGAMQRGIHLRGPGANTLH
jgi:hypothetical protein